MYYSKTNRPNDITTIYNEAILKTYDVLSRTIDSEKTTNEDRVRHINNLVELYRSENELLGLSIHDKHGKRYMNYLHCSPEDTIKNNDEGNIRQKAYFLLLDIEGHYSKGSQEFFSVKYLPTREANIIYTIFTSKKSSEILKRNDLGYNSKYEKYVFFSEEDKKYCNAVLDLIKEISIRTYNYCKYIAGTDYLDSTDEDVMNLYACLLENSIRDKDYANKGLVGRILQRARQKRKMREED